MLLFTMNVLFEQICLESIIENCLVFLRGICCFHYVFLKEFRSSKVNNCVDYIPGRAVYISILFRFS